MRRTSLVLLLLIATAYVGKSTVRAECHDIPVTWYSPTGMAGCAMYGTGIASTWEGPGAATNDCVFPWRDCQTIQIRSLRTGIVITVTPTMFCDCYVGTPSARLVDLSPQLVRALGLDLRDGLYDVAVWPIGDLPDTAMR